MEGVLGMTAFFVSVVLIWGGFLLTRHRERMAIIERGLGSEEVKALYERRMWHIGPLASLKWGIVFVCIGLAVVVGVWLHGAYDVQEGVIPGMIALFAGAGLIVFYAIARNKVTS